MNPQKFFRLIVLCHRRSADNAGFALPMAIMVGLVLTVIGIVIMQRSMFQQNDSTSKAATDQAQNAAETGIAKIQDLLTKNRYAAEMPDCLMAMPSPTPSPTPSAGWLGRDANGRCNNDGNTTNSPIKSWANFTSTAAALTEARVCEPAPTGGSGSGSTNPELLRNQALIVNSTTWQNIDGDSNKQYRLISYTYTPPPSGSNIGTAILTVEGRVNGGSGSANKGVSRIEVSIPIKPNTLTPTIPGAWVMSGDVGNNRIQGNVLINDCSVNKDTMITNNVVNPSPPPSPPYTVAYTKQTFPALPRVYCNGVSASTGGFSAANFTVNPSPTPSAGSPDAMVTIASPMIINNPTGNIVLPRAGDVATSKTTNSGATVQVYEYCINQITSSGNNTITIQNSPPAKVNIYLGGELKGNNEIIHTCLDGSGNPLNNGCQPADFQLFAYGQPVSGNRPLMCLTGNRKIEGFILAPEYLAGVAGGGGGAGGVKGTIWVYDWSNSSSCGSNTSNIVVEQTAVWGDMYGSLGLPQNQPPAIDPISGWRTREVAN